MYGGNQGWGENLEQTTVYTSTGQGSYGLTYTPPPGVPQLIPGQYYSIWSKKANKVIDISQQENEKGLAIIYDHHGGPNQRYAFDLVGNGIFQIRSQLSGKVLTVTGNSSNNGVRISEQDPAGQPGQSWQIKSGGEPGQVVILSYFGKAMDCCEEETSNGTKIIQWPPTGAANQAWYIRPA